MDQIKVFSSIFSFYSFEPNKQVVTLKDPVPSKLLSSLLVRLSVGSKPNSINSLHSINNDIH